MIVCETSSTSAGIATGAFFRNVTHRGRNRPSHRLRDRTIARIIICPAAAGLEDDVGGHSLRAGFATSTADFAASPRAASDPRDLMTERSRASSRAAPPRLGSRAMSAVIVSAGLATAMADANVSFADSMRQTRYKSIPVALGYVRRSSIWQANGAAKVGL